jgi:carboxyl-terminal processing protease
VVVAVATSSPAEVGGVRVGDEVLAIDGWTIGTGALTEASQRLEGPPGSVVTVRIRREGATRDVRLKRERLL